METKPDDWFDDDAFWERMQPYMFGERGFGGPTLRQVDDLIAWLGLRAPADVLDLPCGPGRHSLELARRGFRVTAVDRTRAYLDEVERHSAEADLRVEVIEADMREFRRDGAYDLALNLFTSFGYFDDPADDLRVLGGFHASLRPGGTVVLDVVSKEWLAGNFQRRDWRAFDDGALFLEERTVRDAWSWIDTRWILVTPDGERTTFRFGHRLFAASELVRLVAQAGFVDVAAFGDLSGQPFSLATTRLVVRGTKPA